MHNFEYLLIVFFFMIEVKSIYIQISILHLGHKKKRTFLKAYKKGFEFSVFLFMQFAFIKIKFLYLKNV